MVFRVTLVGHSISNIQITFRYPGYLLNIAALNASSQKLKVKFYFLENDLSKSKNMAKIREVSFLYDKV
jgi:hypothetical protein